MDLTTELAALGQFYIFPQNFEMGKLCYFNFWEIENLYLLPDILGFWKKKDDNESLTLPVYILFLIKIKDVTIQSWLKTIRRTIVSPIYNNDDDLEKYKKNCETNIQRLSDFDQKKLDTNKKMENFFEAVIDQNLLQWIPGKEVYKALKNAYNFNLGDVDLSTLSVADSVRKIIE